MAAPNCNSCAASHIGLIRELNEDSFVRRDEAGLWAVADGLGGHAAGDLASRAVARRLEGVAERDDLTGMLAAAGEALHQANAELFELEARFGRGRAPGSTVAVLLIRGDEAAVTWAGDSRIYRLRGGQARQVTRDHSHVQELIDEQLIRPEEAESHPMAHAITRAVGIDRMLELESARLEVLPGDRFLLCTDGLSRLLSLAEIQDRMKMESQEESVQSLLDTALERGAPDNITVVSVDCRG